MLQMILRMRICLFFHFTEGEDEFGANPFGADYIDVFSVKLNDLFHDGQAKSGSFFIFSSGQICLIETFPYFFQTVFGDSDTGITDRDKHFLIFGRGLNGDLGIRMTELDCRSGYRVPAGSFPYRHLHRSASRKTEDQW